VVTEACAASSRPSGTGDPFLFLRTGAKAPAYSRSASPDFAKGFVGQAKARSVLLIRYPPRVQHPRRSWRLNRQPPAATRAKYCSRYRRELGIRIG